MSLFYFKQDIFRPLFRHKKKGACILLCSKCQTPNSTKRLAQKSILCNCSTVLGLNSSHVKVQHIDWKSQTTAQPQ